MTKVFKSAALVVLAGVLVFAANLTVAQDAKQSRTIQIEGSTTVGPIADAYAEVFQNMYPGFNIPVMGPQADVSVTLTLGNAAEIQCRTTGNP